MVNAYHDMLMTRQNVVRAEVTSAEPLAQERVDLIAQRLATLTGKRVMMVTKVKRPSGGVFSRVGGAAPDASIATQLKKIRERLAT